MPIRPQNCTKGDFYLALDIAKFRDLDDYLEDVEDLAEVIRTSGEEVYLPGETEDRRSAAAGSVISLDDDMAAQLAAIGERGSDSHPSPHAGKSDRPAAPYRLAERNTTPP